MKNRFIDYNKVSKYKPPGKNDIYIEIVCYLNDKSWICPDPNDHELCTRMEKMHMSKSKSKKQKFKVKKADLESDNLWE